MTAGCAGAGVPAHHPAASSQNDRELPLPADVVERAAAPLRVVSKSGALSIEQLQVLLGDQEVVCVAESHSDAKHHYVQLALIEMMGQGLASEGRPFAVGFEMFERAQQPFLERFARGELRGEAFVAQSGYLQRWGFDFSLYRPLLERASDDGAELVALNAPKIWTKQVARQGLDGIDDELRAELPELDLESDAHRAFFFAAMGGHPTAAGKGSHGAAGHRHGSAANPGLENYYQAQVVWDETMAESASRWLDGAGGQAAMLIVAGAGHCHESAIPMRIERRTGKRALSVRPLRESQVGQGGVPHDWEFDLLVIVAD